MGVTPVCNVGTRNNKSELNKKQIKVEEKEVKGDEEKESEKKSCPDCFQEKIGPGISHKCTEEVQKIWQIL